MHSALFKLLLLSNKAALRRTFRGVKSVRGALLLLFTVGFVAMMIVPQIVAAIAMRSHPEALNFADKVEPYASLALLAMAMLFVFTSAGEKAIYFSPAEVDFLFPAPFTRHELLIYKLVKTAVGLVLMSLFFSLMMMVYFRSWLSSLAGIMLSLAMLQLVGMATAMVGQIVAESIYTRARRILLVVLLLMLFVGLGQIGRRVQAGGIAELAAGLRESQTFRVLLAPFEVFTRVTFAEAMSPAWLGWGAAALAIDLGLLILILKLDANYLESAAAISQKVYEQMRRARMGGGVAMPAGARAGRFRLPQPPRLAGAGPVAWRQLLLAVRTSRHMFVACLGFAVVFLVMSRAIAPGLNGPGAGLAPAMGIAMTMYLSFVFSMQLPWAFRGDIDHIDFLKTLPMHPMILALGELGGGVLLMTLIQLVMFALFAAAAPAGVAVTLTAIAFSLPFNAMLFSMGNLLFLVYPVRLVSGTTFDFQTFGRMMLFFMLQTLLMFPLFGIPAAMGGLAYLFSGYSPAAFAATAWVILVAELVPILMLVAWAFHRFDPSTQTPAT
ncbi:MAG: putative ABC exporter domain-containing protein [Isosphaeraceae bacterium]